MATKGQPTDFLATEKSLPRVTVPRGVRVAPLDVLPRGELGVRKTFVLKASAEVVYSGLSHHFPHIAPIEVLF